MVRIRAADSQVRMTASKRVVAGKRPPVDDKNSCFKKLLKRELGCQGNWAFKRCSSEIKFRNFDLLEEYDTFDPKEPVFQDLPFMRRRARIVEIAAAKDLVFALAHSGACAALSRETNKRVCFLNVSNEEVVRSLFYNKNNESIITVSVYACDDFSTLRCRSTPLEYIRRGQPDGGFALFESEWLKWPGFVEFDDVNGKVLTYTAQSRTYKIFDLKNYGLLYTISDDNVSEIKISPGIMLLIYDRLPSHVPLKILNIEDGSVLKSFSHMLKRNRKIDFIEQFNDKLLVKQEMENLQILDVRTSSVVEVNRTEFMTPTAFIFLYENQLFLTFRKSKVGVWNFRGELVTSFEDHLLWYPDCNTSNIYITSEQDIIISYCKNGLSEASKEGSINVSNILSGKLLWKIHASALTAESSSTDPISLSPSDPDRSAKAIIHPAARSRLKSSTASVKEALEDVTALFYDEERNEIYTGNRQGYLHVWSN